MSDRRKPLPYTASKAIDCALMANSDAIRALMPLVRGQVLDPAEKMAHLAEAIHRIHESTAALKEARAARPENGEGQ